MRGQGFRLRVLGLGLPGLGCIASAFRVCGVGVRASCFNPAYGSPQLRPCQGNRRLATIMYGVGAPQNAHTRLV